MEGILRIGIPTGKGANGVRKEALEVAKRMLKEMTSEPITQKWCKYYPLYGDIDAWVGHKWGMVISAKVPNLEYSMSIMESFEYDIVESVRY